MSYGICSQTADVVTADIPALQSFRLPALDADKDVEDLRDETGQMCSWS